MSEPVVAAIKRTEATYPGGPISEHAALALIRRSKRQFGQDPDPSHLGRKVEHTAYGYGIMKAVSQGDAAALCRTLADFNLPSVAPIPTLDPGWRKDSHAQRPCVPDL